MKLLKSKGIFWGIFLSGLMGCGPVMQTHYEYQPPQTDFGKMCILQCQQSQTMCDQNCRMQADMCRRDAHDRAMMDYFQYQRARDHDRLPVDRSPASFENTFLCNQECGCGQAFNTCYATCGGTVIPHEQCVAFCDKKTI